MKFCVLLFLIQVGLTPINGQCLDNEQLSELQRVYSQDSLYFWPSKIVVPEDEKGEAYVEEIEQLSRQLKINRTNKGIEIRLWQVSDLYYQGVVYELRNRRGKWQGRKIYYNKAWSPVKKRIYTWKPTQTTIDSFVQQLDSDGFFNLPPQPQDAYLCTPLDNVYTYVVELMIKGRYRLFYYQDPEYYAKKGAWPDQQLLDVIQRFRNQ